jgi:hypothetical protein
MRAAGLALPPLVNEFSEQLHGLSSILDVTAQQECIRSFAQLFPAGGLTVVAGAAETEDELRTLARLRRRAGHRFTVEPDSRHKRVQRVRPVS